eukprot:m.234818 g.234818  ORF g.234818 m.234818 type:complete len:134 (-) comp17090_c4_seq7:433-834(-)
MILSLLGLRASLFLVVLLCCACLPVFTSMPHQEPFREVPSEYEEGSSDDDDDDSDDVEIHKQDAHNVAVYSLPRTKNVMASRPYPDLQTKVERQIRPETRELLQNRWTNMRINKTREDFRRVPDPPSSRDLNC